MLLLGTLGCSASGTDARQQSSQLAETPFELGESSLSRGDQLKILSVRTDTGDFSVGTQLEVRGTYELSSAESANLYLGTTATTSVGGRSEIAPEQTCVVDQGSGSFVLATKIPWEGNPHISFYRLSSGGSLGGVYFGN